MKMNTLAPLAIAVSCSISLLTGCGSSDDDASSDISISGSIVAAPVSGAAVSVIDASGNPVAGPVDTNSSGQYTLTIPGGSLGQDLIIKSTGGAFTDEATGNSGSAGEMFAYALANSLSEGGSVSATPGSTIVANLVMTHSRTLTQATNDFAGAFGYTPDVSIVPEDATVAGSDASDASKLAGFRAAAFSQMAMDLGLSQDNQFDMFTALARDLSDGELDGEDASGAVDIGLTGRALNASIQNQFSAALVNFQDSSYNNAGLDNAQIGNVPFAKVALTDTYKVEYVAGTMGAMEGKSMFQIHVTNRSSGADVTGLTPMLMPMMHMSTMTHSSAMPADAISEDGDGLYTVKIYYLMASQMMDGSSMGFWDLKFTVGGEVAHFYPAVMMSMGDTAKTRLKGQADVIKDMMSMDVSRDYFIFKDSLTGTGMGPYAFTMFIAAKETMMSFPAIINGNTLASGMGGTSLTISSIAVDVSVNDASSVAATDNGDGTWTVSGLTLTAGSENEIEVTLTVNGERKTSDGTAEGVNAIFTVTPGMSM
jgi:hypothetical protein